MSGEKRILRAWLKGRDTPCPCCKYNLRGLTSGRCPECGSPLELSITAQAPLFYTVAMISVGAALGVEAIYEFNYVALFFAGSGSVFLFETLLHSGMVMALAAIMLVLLRARKWWWMLGDSASRR